MTYGQLTALDVEHAPNIPSWYEEAFILEVARRLQLPTPFELSTYALVDSGRTRPRRGYPTGIVSLGIVVDGRTADAGVLTSSAFPPLDRAILFAVRAATRDSAIPELPGRLAQKPVNFRLRVGLWDLPQAGTPMFRARVPVFTITSLGQELRPLGAWLHSRAKLPAGVYGGARMHYVVDASGVPLEGTALITSADHAVFAQAARDFVAQVRFTPTTIGTCAVPYLVEQSFHVGR
ncbi:MAG: hypothetical protein ACRENU_03110 [Gemmatimonadaceae bacterium]